jgi:hypothetical protein
MMNNSEEYSSHQFIFALLKYQLSFVKETY